MTRPRASDTRARILAAAVDLFMSQGVEKTSLREIAEQLGITKAALYYHFRAKDELLRSLIDPFFEEVDRLLTDPVTAAMPPRRFLETYFDLIARHRSILQLLIRDLSGFAHVGLEEKVLGWQVRLHHLLVGPDAGPAERVRAVVALGGLQDTAVLLPDLPTEQVRPVAVAAACAALGLPEDAPPADG